MCGFSVILILKGVMTFKSQRVFGGRDVGGGEATPISFSPVTATNVRISHQNILTFSFNSFTTNCKVIPSASPKLLNLNQDHPSKKVVLLVKSL